MRDQAVTSQRRPEKLRLVSAVISVMPARADWRTKMQFIRSTNLYYLSGICARRIAVHS